MVPRLAPRSLVVAIAVAALTLGVLAGPGLAAPADGNGNKFVVHFDETGIPIDCGDATIWLDFSGWFQAREFKGKGNRNLDLAVFHFKLTYYNAEGDTYRYIDVGPDRAYIDQNGDLIITIVGRPADAGDMGFSLSGRMVINADTGEVTWSGKEGLEPDEGACAALT